MFKIGQQVWVNYSGDVYRGWTKMIDGSRYVIKLDIDALDVFDVACVFTTKSRAIAATLKGKIEQLERLEASIARDFERRDKLAKEIIEALKASD